MATEGVIVAGKPFVPLTDRLMCVQLIWELGPRRAVRVPIADVTDELRSANLDESGNLIERPIDLGQENVASVDEYLQRDLANLGIPLRPSGYVWCAQQPLNTTWEDFLWKVGEQQNLTSPEPRDDAFNMHIMLEDVEFAD